MTYTLRVPPVFSEKLRGTCFLVAVLAILFVPTCVAAEPSQSSAALVSFVQKAAALVEKEGDSAFPQLRERDGPWYHGDRYVFVWGLDGIRYVYPPAPFGEGENMLKLKDINGKPIGKWMVAKAQGPSGHGWVHYQWPRPGDIFPAWKSTYVQRAVAPSGKGYLVGAGSYNMPVDRGMIEDLVDSAARILVEKGKAGFAHLRDKSGEFVFKDTYVFVMDAEGTELVNSAFPNLEGQNLLGHKDAAGKLLVKEMLDKTQGGKSAWVEYYWARPGSAEQVRKMAYVKRIEADGEEMVVGAGMYEP